MTYKQYWPPSLGLSIMTDDQLIDQLRHAASIWFKNTDLLLLEELIKRFKRASRAQDILMIMTKETLT